MSAHIEPIDYLGPMTDTKPSDVEGLIAELEACAEDYWGELACTAATTLAAQQARMAELEASIGRLMTDLQQLKDALAQVGKEPS